MYVLLWLTAPVILGLAALAYFAGRSRRHVRPAAPAAPAPPAPDPDDIRRALADLLGSMVGTVAPDILARYESIHRRMLAMLPRLGQLDGTSQDLYILHRTAIDYLPTAVQSYLSLVRAGTNEQRLPKALIATRGAGGQARVIAYGSDRPEADSVAAAIGQALAQDVPAG